LSDFFQQKKRPGSSPTNPTESPAPKKRCCTYTTAHRGSLITFV
jgi:hypothetical protein